MMIGNYDGDFRK